MSRRSRIHAAASASPARRRVSDVADFLLGLPQTSSIAFGNRDKRFRAPAANAYFSDDWRVSSVLSINAGLRWEFEAPFREGQGRIANLLPATGFTSVEPVVGSKSDPLLRADVRGVQPRIGVSWRPIPASSVVIRGGYGIYRSTNVYQSIALLLADQPPFAKTVSAQSSPAAPLTLANGFAVPVGGASNTFAVDPDFRVGMSHNWQVSLQRDLPASLTMIATYLGTRGTHLIQEFAPNTYPPGGPDPCASCPSGFIYLSSTGSSLRNAAQLQLRRRLRNGLTASVQYTLAKATDDAAAYAGANPAGAAIAQNWLDLDAERSRSNFDQRHQLAVDFEYTTGMGAAGGALTTGRTASLFKGWTFTGRLASGSGLPLTPVYLAPLSGTGVLGSIRADDLGSHGHAPSGYYFDPAAYAAPPAGQWGTSGRNVISGPAQFSFDAGIGRTFLLGNRLTLEWRLDATNVLNTVVYSTVNTIAGSPQFGLPDRANAMRKLTYRLPREVLT